MQGCGPHMCGPYSSVGTKKAEPLKMRPLQLC